MIWLDRKKKRRKFKILLFFSSKNRFTDYSIYTSKVFLITNSFIRTKQNICLIKILLVGYKSKETYFV